MNRKYKIGIVCAVYNFESYLDECLQSIMKQKYHNFLTIIVNDCSTDDSQKIIDKYVSRDNRFVSLSNMGLLLEKPEKAGPTNRV